MPLRAHANTVVAYLEDRGETVAVAESLTAGGLGQALTYTPGASKVFLGGIIAYTNDVKINFLGIDASLIEEFSVVSEEVANAMADAAREKFGATWGIATTGIAGPGDHQGIPEGTVWVAIRGPINQTIQLQLDSGREAIRTGAISSAIGTFARILSYRTT
ncbi:MAG: CinA family protein [Candidatus Planktophila sp.]